MAKACGVARFAWNWALAEWERQYKAGEKPTAKALKLKWNSIKAREFPWVYDSPKDANQQPFANLDKAFRGFFKKTGRYPRFKAKGRHDSFYVSNDKMEVAGMRVRLPVIGWIRLREELRFHGKIMAAVVYKKLDRWFISIQVDVGELKLPRTGDGAVGVDLGIKTAVTLSDGREFRSPKAMNRHLRRLQRLARLVARRKKGSRRRERAKLNLARLQARVANIRKDWQHKLTTLLCRENQTVAVEDLNVKGMLGNRKLARHIADVGFHEIRRQLEYKAELYGTELLVVDRWFPSTKTCSACGVVKPSMSLSDRVFRCHGCGLETGRDHNAAINIITAGLAGSHARGQQDSRGDTMNPDWKSRELRVGTAVLTE